MRKEIEDQVVGLEDPVQHGHREHLHLFGMALEQDLREDGPGEIVAAAAVADLDLLALDDEILQVLERDVPPRLPVVEAAIGVSLDGDDFGRRTRHGSPLREASWTA